MKSWGSGIPRSVQRLGPFPRVLLQAASHDSAPCRILVKARIRRNGEIELNIIYDSLGGVVDRKMLC